MRLEDTHGNTIVYHGMPLLELLERNGLDLKTMAGERKSAGQVVLASARDGYTVVFSVGELRANRNNPKVFWWPSLRRGRFPRTRGPCA